MNGNKFKQIAMNGLVHNNPTFRLVLGMCPTLAITTSMFNGLGMGLATTFVLVFSNVFVSLLRRWIPDKVRIPAFIIIIATFVTVVEMLMEKFIPDLYDSLGVFIALITVNCIILARAEAYASANRVLESAVDGLSMGLGFTASITLLAAVRELLGTGKLFGLTVFGSWFPAPAILVSPAGGFFMLGALMAIFNYVYGRVMKRHAAKKAAPQPGNVRTEKQTEAK